MCNAKAKPFKYIYKRNATLHTCETAAALYGVTRPRHMHARCFIFPSAVASMASRVEQTRVCRIDIIQSLGAGGGGAGSEQRWYQTRDAARSCCSQRRNRWPPV